MDLYPLYCPYCKGETPPDADRCPACDGPLRRDLAPRGATPTQLSAGAGQAERGEMEMLPVGLALLGFWGLVVLGALLQPPFPSPRCLLGLVLLLWDGVYLAQQPSVPVQVNGAFGLGLVLGVTFSSMLTWIRTQM